MELVVFGVLYLFFCLVSYPVMMVCIVAVGVCLEGSTFLRLLEKIPLPDLVEDPFGTVKSINNRPLRVLARIGLIIIGPFILPVVLTLCVAAIALGWMSMSIGWVLRFVLA